MQFLSQFETFFVPFLKWRKSHGIQSHNQLTFVLTPIAVRRWSVYEIK